MRKVVKVLFVGIVFLFVPVVVFAHPGRTDGSGCHTCRTNCASWGLSTGQYHCHNGGSSSSSSGSSSGGYRQTATRRTTTRRIVYGCTNRNAINYNSSANESDGSCQFESTRTETRTIYYETEVQGDLTTGDEKTIVKGENGEKEITIKTITNESGEEVSSEVVSETVTKEPVKAVIEYKKKTIKVEVSKTDKLKDNVAKEKEESDSSIWLISIILLIVNIIYGKKNTDAKLIINLRQIDSWTKYILYFLYFIFIIPVFIDIILIIIHLVSKGTK